jgi:hypothetical protein
MLNKLKSFFSKNPSDLLTYPFTHKVYEAIIQEGYFTIEIPEAQIKSLVNFYQFPYSFEEELEDIEKLGYKSVLDFLNGIYQKSNIQLITEQEYNDGFKVDLLCFDFKIYKPNSNEGVEYQAMIFFIVGEEGKDDHFLLLSNRSNDASKSEHLHYAKYFEKPHLEKSDPFEALRKIMAAALSHIQYPVPESIMMPYDKMNFTVENNKIWFQEAAFYLNYHLDDKEETKKIGAKIYDEYLAYKEKEEYFQENLDNEELYDSILEETIFNPWNLEVASNLYEGNIWHSDWKFDPEEAQLQISDLLDQDIDFEFPEDTYSHLLFPYIQEKLAPLGYRLMSFSTDGDYYLFFLIKLKYYERLMELNEKIPLELNDLE